MERRKLTQTKTKGPGFWKCLFACLRSSSDDRQNAKKEKNSDILAAKHSVSVTYTTSSYYLMQPNKIISDNNRSLNDALSLVYSEKLKNCCVDQKSNTAIAASKVVNREETDKLVKSALTKYLAQKRNESLEQQKSEPLQVKKRDKEKKLQSDFLSVVTVDSSETLKLINEDEEESNLKLKVEFPTKSRSAPTNSSAHDSLADICSKMSRYKQENNKSDSYVTCCSEQNSKASTNSKKKLELVFNNKSSDDTLPFFDGHSNLSLSYKINCEVASSAEETSKTDSEWLDDDRSFEFLRKQKRLQNQELHLHPTAKGELGAYNSTSSLRWKLIISHHGHGDIDRYY